jgi:hypothetical protein
LPYRSPRRRPPESPRQIDIRHRDKEGEFRICSMDDETVYGPRAHTLSFGAAAQKKIICCYKVIISLIDKEVDKGSATDALVWRKYRMLRGDILQDIPKHVLITSAAVTKGGTTRTKHFALVCNSSFPLKMGGRVFRFSNAHYKNFSKDGKVGKSATGKRTTAALVRWTGSPISGAECDSVIDFYADFCTPYCVELFDPVRISPTVVAKLNRQIASGLGIRQWRLAVATIKQ